MTVGVMLRNGLRGFRTTASFFQIFNSLQCIKKVYKFVPTTMTIKQNTEKDPLNIPVLTQAAKEARGLAMDAVVACNSGHLGLPLGDAEMGAVLFGHSLQFNPEDPKWLNRDRFVLSAGHGSMFLYSWLHLSGYDLSLQEIKNFRKLHSKTPGHPESIETPGVECTTGPLGQGIGNSVGMAMAAKMAEAIFNTKEQTIFNHHIVCLCGDGCMQEGVSSEACALAGRQGLDNLILVYDSNDVTLDALANKTQLENTAERFDAYGFDVQTINGNSMQEFLAAYEKAKGNHNERPKLIIAKTIIGKGIPEVEGTSKAHGEAGAKFVDAARKGLGLPEESFYVSEEVRDYFKRKKEERIREYKEWQNLFVQWKKANPKLAKELEEGVDRKVPSDLLSKIPAFPVDSKLATRVAGGKALNAIAGEMPLVVSGSADLHGSTKNYIDNGGDFDLDCRAGRNIYFGIREHAMGAIVNGFGYYGIFRASGATFLVFSDYMRPSIRLAALSQLPVFFIFTHDSVGVGEDGPTHEPVEHINSLRLIPNLDVIRPADAEETAGAFVAALERIDGPTALILSRQDVPTLSEIPVEERRKGVLKGAYIAKKETQKLEQIIISTGSELQHAINAAKELSKGTRVVSMPCFERFDRQSKDYQESVLPKDCKKRVAIEAGTTGLWYRYVGSEGKVIGIDHFGLSGPGAQIMKEFGITAESIINEIKSL